MEDAHCYLVKLLEYFQSRIIPAVWFWVIIDAREEQWEFEQYKPICFQVGHRRFFFFLMVEEHRNMDHLGASCYGNHKITFSKTFLFNYIHHWLSSGVNFIFSLKLQSAKEKRHAHCSFNLSFVTYILGKRFFSSLQAFFADVPSSFIDIVNYYIGL